MKILRIDVGEVARQKGVWYTKHHKPAREQERHNLTLVHGDKYGVVGKGIYTIRKQEQHTTPQDAA